MSAQAIAILLTAATAAGAIATAIIAHRARGDQVRLNHPNWVVQGERRYKHGTAIEIQIESGPGGSRWLARDVLVAKPRKIRVAGPFDGRDGNPGGSKPVQWERKLRLDVPERRFLVLVPPGTRGALSMRVVACLESCPKVTVALERWIRI